jgi:hypothetical protein
MSPIATRVAARLATAQQTNDLSGLLTADAAADALALFREAAPAPDQHVDAAALVDVHLTLFVRGQAANDARGPDMAAAGIVAGFVFERAPQLLPDMVRDHLASVSDPLRDGRFAYAAAHAHAAAATPEEGEAAPGDAVRPEDTTADLVALDRALAWSSVACQAAAERGAAAEAADALVQRMGLLTARFNLAADVDALAAAARDAMTVTAQLSPDNTAHAAYLPPAAEAVIRSALALGSPTLDEAEQVAAALPPGAATEATTQMLGLLRVCTTDPVTWPGELDARMGLVVLAEATQTGHAGLLAVAVRRLRAARAEITSAHPGYLEITNALGVALVSFGEVRGEAQAIQEGLALLGQGGRLFRLLTHQLSGPGVPEEAGAAATVLDVLAGAAADGIAVTSEWRAEFAATVERLPARHPSRPEYATLLEAVTTDPDRAATAVTIAATKIDWRRLAAELRAAGNTNSPALMLAEGFESAAGTIGELKEIVALYESVDSLGQADDDRDGRIEWIRSRLADDAGDDAMSADVRANLSELLSLLIAERAGATGDSADLGEALRSVALGGQIDDPEMATTVGGGLGFVLGQWMMANAEQVASWDQTLDQETRLAMGAWLAAHSREDTGDEPRLEDAMTAFAELVMAGLTFSAESDVTQLDRLKAIGQRIVDMVGQWDPVRADQVTVLTDSLVAGLAGHTRTLEAIPQDQAAESHADTITELRRRIDELPPAHLAGVALRQQLVVALGGQAFYLRDADPKQARALLAEATELADLEHAIEPIAVVLRQFLDHTRQVLEQAEPRSVPGRQPGTSVREVSARLRAAGDSAEAIREVLADQAIPVWVRVNTGFTSAFRLTAALRVEAGLDCAEQTVDLLATLTDRGADSASAEHAIASLIGGMPTTYVSAMLAMLHANGRATRTGPLVERAAVLAERSRGLLLARQLEGRTDLGELRSAHPELADQFEALTAQLAAGPDELAVLCSDDKPPAVGRAEWARWVKFRASRDLDALIERIRAENDDLRDFLCPFTSGQLRELAVNGPVVMLNYPAMAPAGEVAASVGPFAFVVTSKAITSVRLAIERSEVADVARRWADAIASVDSRGADRPGPAQLRSAVEEMVRILSWTWHRVISPVLAAAELPARADGRDWQRIWWIPDGPFHALPLHAAQCPESGCEWGAPDRSGCGAALDAVVSSYVPGFRTLAHARRRAAGSAAAEGPALIVAVTDDELPGAETAAKVAAERLGGSRPLTGPAATHAAVTGALVETSVAHFGCHAASNPTEPSGGVLYLPGGEQLTVREICQARPRAARLAFLTACSTARTSQRLASEAIHLSSAFLVAGFGAAVGTLWEIDSRDACRVTTEFYQRITGQPPQDGAIALHHCVRALRHERPGAPYIWSAFVHAGA